jgi:hypothetical protein
MADYKIFLTIAVHAHAIFGTALYSACQFVCPFVCLSVCPFFVRLLVCSHQYVSLIAY